MSIATCHRWLFAALVLFTASQHESLRLSYYSSGSILFAAAQDKPSFTTPQYSSPNISHRTFVCDRFAQYAAGERDVRYLLEGLNLSVGIVDQGNDIFLRLNRTGDDKDMYSINEEDPGIFVHILDELAARGRFSWRKSFAWIQPPNTTQINPLTNKEYSWTDVLLDAVMRYDFSFAEWVHNQERRKLGISFPVGWFDASTILVQNKVEKGSEFELEAFLRPFSTEVWYLICAVVFFSGIVYWMIDKIEYPDEKINSVVYDTFLTTLTFTQHHQYWDPSTHGKRIFGYSAAFWALIMASSYTANLASFLVAQQRPVIFAETLEQVEERDLTLCVRAGAAVAGQVSRTFPGISVRGESDFEDVYRTLREGEGCEMMASRAADFDAFKDDQEKNPSCTLEWVGRAAFINKGGPGTLVDTSIYCTSTIRYVLDFHMHEMLADGTIENLWNTHLRSLENYKLCVPKDNAVQGLDGEYALNVTDLGGVFVFHGALVVIAILVTIVESPWRRKRHRKKAESQSSMAEEDSEGANAEDLTGYMSQFRPSMERLHSSRSMRNLIGADMATFYQTYSDRNDSFVGSTIKSQINNSIRHGESIELPADTFLQSLQKMQAKVDELQRRGEQQRRLAGDVIRPPDMPLPVIEDDEVDGTTTNDNAGNPNEGD